VIAFLDASAVIYAVEGPPVWSEALKHQLRELARSVQGSAGGVQLAVSCLNRAPWPGLRHASVGHRMRRSAAAAPAVGYWLSSRLIACTKTKGRRASSPSWNRSPIDQPQGLVAAHHSRAAEAVIEARQTAAVRRCQRQQIGVGELAGLEQSRGGHRAVIHQAE